MKVVAVIPARFAAVRLPGKPLLRETGRYLIQHVVERVAQARSVSAVIVATDDERIASAVRSFGGEARMTRTDHASGTDRVAEVAQTLDADVVLNVQGDEPEMDPENIERLVAFMAERREFMIATVACPFAADAPASGPGSPQDPNCVKVVTTAGGSALYFSRALIPFPRDLAMAGRLDSLAPRAYLLHLGLYGFHRDDLLGLANMPRLEYRQLERIERLEQLRWMEAGYEIGVAIGTHPSVGIDTPEDYARFVQRAR